MNHKELIKKYLEFFKSKNHAVIESAPLIPENDPTVLFTTAGMHPLVPFLLGQKHPLGKRMVDYQKCLRTDDINEIGDCTHHTFFIMLGNWSLGDYFKKEAIEYSFEFLTKSLNIPLDKLAFTCFAGDNDAPKDEESANTWMQLGISKDRIAFLSKKDNWWGPAGETGPCGPDTEMFYWTGKEKAPKIYDSKDKKWVEIWNDVFMQYDKQKDGSYKLLIQQNVDTGLGVERVTAILQGYNDNYRTEMFWPIIEKISNLSDKKYEGNEKLMRIIADHLRASVFILGDERGVVPSNVDQGYVLRRLIRRSIRCLRELGIDISQDEYTTKIAKVIIGMYKDLFKELEVKKEFILEELKKEEKKFKETLEKGLKKFEQISSNDINGADAFLLFQSYGFPIEMIEDLALEKGIKVDIKGFDEEYKKHQELSRVGAEKKFKSGLSDTSVETTKLHTAAHLLMEALRKVLKSDIRQKGSNITPERLRLDFNFDRKLTENELKDIENEVNKIIKLKIVVKREEMTVEEAFNSGAHGEFGAKYPPKVSVYSIGDYSKEICTGPHVSNTSELGCFKIVKEESSSSGIRRIKAVLEL